MLDKPTVESLLNHQLKGLPMQCIKVKTLYTGTEVVQDTYLVFDQGVVVETAQELKGEFLGEYEVVTPAFIDPHSHIGMVRGGEPETEAEANDRQDSLLISADALDSLQMDDVCLGEAVEAGVLYSCILPGSGNIIGGRSAVIRTYALDTNLALVARAGLKAAFGYNPMSTVSWQGTRPSTRMGALAILRRKLDDVLRKEQRKQEAEEDKQKEITFSAEEDALRDVLNGLTRLRVHVHKIDDIAALLRLVNEFGIRVTVEHAMGVDKPDIFRELKQRGIPVIYGPLDSFPYKVELKHESWRNVRHLVESGVEFGLMSDHPVTPARQILLQCRWLLRHGYSTQQAIEVISRKNAEILGLENMLGTLEPGKWASFTCWNGDPFHLTSYPVTVFGEGTLLHTEEKKAYTPC
ncbi:MAG: amidohydrolase family protein [Thermodesulfobacteriota bacterium]